MAAGLMKELENITHLQITSNHNMAAGLMKELENITHLQITSNHNWRVVEAGSTVEYNSPSNYVKSQLQSHWRFAGAKYNSPSNYVKSQRKFEKVKHRD